ncbi:MAG: MaoC family dehydratase, partial [Caulobacteraceae bacterium]|nr:MaoC family dehydratase [Caulobacteraceae bacterium]
AVTIATTRGQAALYRLSGDHNPLHIDPRAAEAGGFERPILHGLCSYGVASRAVIQALCGHDPHRLRRFDVRFASPVYPGETLETQIWKEAPGRAAFRVRVIERDIIVLSNGRADYQA